jgi:hypothetical protein
VLLYHGSNVVIERPSIAYSRDRLDFGRGFYVTSYKNQAANWAKRRVAFDNSAAIVNTFNFDESKIRHFKVKKFAEYSSDWLEFVCANRRGAQASGYDLIIGPVADDRVFQAVNMYFQGYWDQKRTLDELRFYKQNDQYCFASQDLIDACLAFDGSVVVEDE